MTKFHRLKKCIIAVSLFLFLVLQFVNIGKLVAQNVAITDNESYTADNSAMLDVMSTTKGMLVPRLDSVQRVGISSPALGLLVFDTTKNSFMYYNGSGWITIPQLASSAASGEALFAVVNHLGDTVFAVYHDGVRIFVDPEAKGKVGGFAISGRTPTKDGETVEYFRVTPDSTRIWVNDSLGAKGKVGGFAISGRTPTKDGLKDYFTINKDSARIYIDSTAAKGNVGGFAISGRTPTKAGYTADDFFNVSAGSNADVIPSDARIAWYPKKEAFLAGRVQVLDPDSVGLNAFITGYHSIAKGDYSQAFGYQAIARGDYSTAIGKNAIANATNSFAFGDSVLAQGLHSYAFGHQAIAGGLGSFALGTTLSGIKTQALKDNSVAIGLGCIANGIGAISIGTGNSSTADYSFSSGKNSSATKIGTTAIGQNVNATGVYSTAFGYSTNASGDYSTSLGYTTNAAGANSISMGKNCSATGASSVAIGNDSHTNNNMSNSIAIGYQCNTNHYESFAAGSGSTAGNSSLVYGYAYALGYHVNATGGESLCFGVNSNATGFGSVAIGNNANSSANYSVSIGRNPIASGQYTLALGYRSNAQSYMSTVIGYGTAPGTVDGWLATEPLFVIGNGLNSPSNAITVLKNGNIGVGTTGPISKLDILQVGGGSGTNIALSLRAGNNSNYYGNHQIVLGYDQTFYYAHSIRSRHNSTSGTGNAIDFYTWKYGDAASTIGGQHTLTLENGNVGIGTTSPAVPLQISRSGDIPYLLLNTTSTTNKRVRLQFGQNGTLNWELATDASVNNTDDLYFFNRLTSTFGPVIKNNGNVGIGTTNPAAKLEVNGFSYFRNSIGIGINNSTSDLPISLTCTSSLRTGIQIANSTSTPSYIMQVVGSSVTGRTGNFEIWDNNPNVNVLTITPYGNIGFGTTNPGGYKLYVAGSAYCTGTWVSSDIHWKKNIVPITNTLNKLLEINAVNYEWKADEYKEMNFDNGVQLGVIAQDVEKIFPELVRTDINGYKAVSYEKLSVLLLEGMKEQQKQIKNLEEQNELIKSELEAIKAELGKK